MRTKDGPLGRRLQVGDRVGLTYFPGQPAAPVFGYAKLKRTEDKSMALACWSAGGVDAVLMDDRASVDGLLPGLLDQHLLDAIGADPRAVRVGRWFIVRCWLAVAREALRRWTRLLRPVKRGAR